MYKLCKTEQSAARQRGLELGLLEVMESRHFDEISVSDLCDWLHVPRKSFYRYFSGKDGILHALIDHTLMEYDQSSGWLPGRERTVQMELENLFQFWKGQKRLLDALERSGLSGVLVERAIANTMTVTGLRRGEERKQLLTVPEHTALFVSCGLMSMIIQWHHGDYALSVERMAGIACRVLTKPLLTEK